jgi:hypothetical protein
LRSIPPALHSPRTTRTPLVSSTRARDDQHQTLSPQNEAHRALAQAIRMRLAHHSLRRLWPLRTFRCHRYCDAVRLLALRFGCDLPDLGAGPAVRGADAENGQERGASGGAPGRVRGKQCATPNEDGKADAPAGVWRGGGVGHGEGGVEEVERAQRGKPRLGEGAAPPPAPCPARPCRRERTPRRMTRAAPGRARPLRESPRSGV